MNSSSIFSISYQTIRSIIRDRLVNATLVLSLIFVGFSNYLSTLTIIEERKILLDFGFSAISICSIAIAIFLGVTVVGKEIEKRTIYTVLSKPVSRTGYLVGKFLGGTLVNAGIVLMNSLLLVGILFYQGLEMPAGFWATIYLIILESIIVFALGMCLSLFTSSLILASSLTLAGFLLGRSNPSLRKMGESSHTSVWTKLFRVLSDLFPNLDRYNIREVVAYGKPYPEVMLSTSTIYFGCYVLLLLSLSVYLFYRKDLT